MRCQGQKPRKDAKMTVEELMAANPYRSCNYGQSCAYSIAEALSKTPHYATTTVVRRPSRMERTVDIAVDSAVRAASVTLATAIVGLFIQKFR